MKKFKEIKNKNIAKKRLTVLIITVLLIAFIISVVWELLINTQYYGYKNGFTPVASLTGKIMYENKEGEYLQIISTPTFMGDDGFLQIEWGNDPITEDENGNTLPRKRPYISLYIYPSVLKKTNYFLTIDYDSEHSTASEITYTKDGNGNYVVQQNFEDKKAVAVFNQYIDVVTGALKLSENTWTLGGWESVTYGMKCR